ncbi:DUF3500 domain-containing protein [Mumia sp. Pv 4-285]|uniref:DUF3500 domain-containing protein n=1 Tax=Mumia qirimensis TaxID=3234852 RepID=UPI00351CCBA4
MSDPSAFRAFLFPHDHPRLADIRGMDPYGYRDAAREDVFTGDLIKGWTPLYENDFVGVTEDGTLRAGLYPLTPAEPGEEAPVAAMVEAAERLLGVVEDGARDRLTHAVDAVEWQTWANPEFMQFDTGLRLDQCDDPVRDAALALVESSLSPQGYALAHRMMLINGFLGEVVGLESLLNAYSYNIALYGTPDLRAPWGWQLFGHHAALNCLVVDGRMSLSPVFLGAEPDQIDTGPYAGGGRPFAHRVDLATRLMASLPDDLRAEAITYDEMVDPAMPEGRVHPGDERHLAGAFQDNRVIPVEGVAVARLPTHAQALVLALVEDFVALLPEGPRRARMREIGAHLDETTFSWIGGWKPGDVFYFRIQSPVVIVELDHHCGVFLDYDVPQPFHIHTVMRTPHGNDYARAWVRQWQARQE